MTACTLPDNGLYGIAIYNFNPEHQDADSMVGQLRVNVGEALHLQQEDGAWYYATVVHRNRCCGYVPKSYVKVVDGCRVEHDGTAPTFVFAEQPPIVHEITLVLREWSTLWQHLYISNREVFEKLRMHISELINHRSKIISGTLPVDELKEVTCEATKVIALGNKIVGLDLVVRDIDGNTINSDETSTTDLYTLHQNATELINNKTEHKETKPQSAQIAHIFVVSVRNFTYKMSEDAELLMFLYDWKEGRAITENYVVQWSKEGLMIDLDKINNLKVMFTDLGKKDLERERVYLVCHVVRVGGMEARDGDHHHHRRSSNAATASLTPKKSSTLIPIRRPCGVAAKDITSFFSGATDSELDKDFPVPFYNCEKDNLEQTLRRIIAKDDNRRLNGKEESKKTLSRDDSRAEPPTKSSLYVGVKLLHGDIKQVRDENPHLVLGNVNIARKMGFPEVILPGEIRNDLYITIMGGEFPKGNKKSDKNIEVRVTVCNTEGKVIPDVIFLGDSKNPTSAYQSVVYYHDAKPQWCETFKVAMPIEEFKRSHVKFTFKHRSSNEAKDKGERPFAFAYVTLMQKDDTTLMDGRHSLSVYKYDHKKYVEEEGADYLCLPSKDTHGSIPFINGISLSSKDSFMISSNVCSTKLTQNVNILDLLNWTTKKDVLDQTLDKLKKVEGEEIVKFLTDILDTLFNILMAEDKPQPRSRDGELGAYVDYDMLVFDCLLHITGIVTHDWRYQHFEPVLNLYIKENYSATLAYNKMLEVLCKLIEQPKNDKCMKIFRTMKSFQYIMRFITQSRYLHSLMKLPDEDAVQREFKAGMDRLFVAFIELMAQPHDFLLREQGACLKYLPGAIPDILNVYSARELSYKLCILFDQMPLNRLTKQKVMTMNEVVQGLLFRDTECRNILLPNILLQLKMLLEENQEDTNHAGSQTGRRFKQKSVAKVALLLGISRKSITEHTGSTSTDEVMNVITEMDLCLNTLGDILTMLFHIDPTESYESIAEIIRILLSTVSQCYIKSDKENSQAKQLAAILIDIFRQMTEQHYMVFMATPPLDLLDEKLAFIIEIMTIFKEFVDSNMKIFPDDWCDMKMLQNQVILKTMRYFSHTIQDHFTEKFHHQVWSNYFQCAISYMGQPALQLETFTPNKQMRIIKRFRDMRREMGFEILRMWFNLDKHKPRFVPSLVENILEMTLIPEVELRKATIPIFFDMMQCEFYSSSQEFESFGDTLRNSQHVKGNFNEFEREMIIKLDTLFEGGRGDEEYRVLFLEIMEDHCSQHARLCPTGTKFVRTLASLMDRLLTYRMTMHNDNKENKMACIVNLLDFYAEINRKEMYIRYVYKLYDLHLELGNHTEAGFTLELHSDLLKWSNELLPVQLRSSKYDHASTHMELKELLCTDIIENYDKGMMWECAIAKTKELISQYEELYYYDLLGPLQSKIAGYYNSIMSIERYESEYFRVGYYGLGFPKFLQNKVFVYRGTPLERLVDFQTRICRQFPKAELLSKLTLNDESEKMSNKQYLLINKVVPIEEEIDRFNGQMVSDQIAMYYKWNNVNRFYFSRQFRRKDPLLETPNDFGDMWIEKTFLTTEHAFPHILCWYPVRKEETVLLTPVQNAIETMRESNETLKQLYKRYKEQMKLTANMLSLKLKGILDAEVQGGISNYEQYFFTPEYLAAHPEEEEHIRELKELIAEQNPLLELCVDVHRILSGSQLQGLHSLLEELYMKHKMQVHEKYGVKDCDAFKAEVEVRLRRANKLNNSALKATENSHPNTDPLGNRSRVSSITRAQVQSFKNLTASFNFSASATSAQSELNIFSKPSGMSGTKSLLLSPTRSITGTPGTLKKNKNKEKRRSSKTDSTLNGGATVTTQWYTSDVENTITTAPTPSNGGTPIFELRQELTPKRPLRSEVEKEKRLSRPSSGQYSSRPSSLSLTLRATSSSGTSSNRDSIGTTDSSVSEEDLPPPLPAKLRELDISLRESLPVAPMITINHHPLNYDIAPLLSEKMNGNSTKEKPPTPPPKPPKKNKQP